MIRARIQIDDGPVLDSYDAYGFIFRVADRRFAPPEKKRDSSSYPEGPGVHEDPRTVPDAFDYTAEFILEAPNRNLVNANTRIRLWNQAIRTTTPGSHVRTCRTVTLYDDYHRIKIVGIPEIIDTIDADNYHRYSLAAIPDCVIVPLKIRVTDPSLCQFDTIDPSHAGTITVGDASFPFYTVVYGTATDADAEGRTDVSLLCADVSSPEALADAIDGTADANILLLTVTLAADGTPDASPAGGIVLTGAAAHGFNQCTGFQLDTRRGVLRFQAILDDDRTLRLDAATAEFITFAQLEAVYPNISLITYSSMLTTRAARVAARSPRA